MTGWKKGALLGALVLAACGRGGGGGGGGQGTLASSRPGSDPAPDPTPVTSPTSTRPAPGRCPDGVKVRILGTNPRGVSALSLVPGALDGSCDLTDGGCKLISPATGALDLGTDAHAYDLGTVTYPVGQVPPDATPFLVTLPFASGTATVGDTAGEVHTCVEPIRIAFAARELNPDRCSVTLLLDVGRSIVPAASGAGFDLVPQFRFFF